MMKYPRCFIALKTVVKVAAGYLFHGRVEETMLTDEHVRSAQSLNVENGYRRVVSRNAKEDRERRDLAAVSKDGVQNTHHAYAGVTNHCGELWLI